MLCDPCASLWLFLPNPSSSVLTMLRYSVYVLALFTFLTTPPLSLKAMSFTPEEIVQSVKRHVPDLQVTYGPDSRQLIGKGLSSNRRFITFKCKTFR